MASHTPLQSLVGPAVRAINEMHVEASLANEIDTVAFLSRQRWIVMQEHLFESELSERLAIVRAQHEAFLGTANKYVGLLFRSTETAASAVEALSLGTSQYSPFRIHRERSSAATAHHTLPRSRSEGSDTESASGGRKRVLVCSANHSGGPMLLTKVELDASAQNHRIEVASRRLQMEREALKKSVEKFERNEDRRRQSYLRRKAALMASTAPTPKAGVERAAHLVLSEHVESNDRDSIRSKHDHLEEMRTAMALRNQAAADARRHLDYLASERVREAQRKVHADACAAALHIHSETLKTDHFKSAVDSEASLLHQRRQRAKRDFGGVISKETSHAVNQARKQEHDRNALRVRAACDSMAVEITWPASLNPKSSNKPRSGTIDGDSYARLCGFKHDFVSRDGVDISVADVASIRRVPPNAWSILHAVDPSAAFLTLRSAQAHVVRGPTNVVWS